MCYHFAKWAHTFPIAGSQNCVKYKIPITLTLLILMPLVVLAWLGMRLQSNEEIVAGHQFQQLVDAQLREADQIIVGYFRTLENDLLNTPDFFADQAVTVTTHARQYLRSTPYIDGLFILDAEGQRLFPPATSIASLKEQQFISESGALWSNLEAFQPRSLDNVAPGEIQDNRPQTSQRFSVSGALDRFSRRQPSKALVNSSEENNLINRDRRVSKHGWTVWYSGTDAQTFFWFWDQRGNLVGLKLSAVQWMSELISRLPDDRTAGDILGDARIKLINEKQDVVYQWGSYQNGPLEPLGQRLLGHPLDGWRLAYYSAERQSAGGLQWLVFIVSLGLMGLVLTGLAVYMWREYRRDMRLAEQRVTFVNQVSHELKTPLTNICMYADLMDSEISDQTQIDETLLKKYSSILASESQRLGRLINNVLSFSRSQNEQLTIHRKPGVVDEIINGSVSMFGPAFAKKGIKILLDLNAEQTVMLDPGALEQVLNNLLGNIEKYAYQGKQARIESSYRDGLTRIRVADAGPGIDAKTADNMFEPFVRGSARITEGVSGTGIGLNIARMLCRLHGGDLRLLRSPEQDRGACFEITLETPVPENNP